MFRLIWFTVLYLIVFICISQVENFPSKATFESHTLEGWEQSIQDNIDWTLHTGSTPTANTGPYFAADGTQYLYLEATGNYNKIGFLDVHVDFKNVSHPFLTFQYHMYGAKMGTLKIQYSLDGVTYTDAWTILGGQGNYWHQGAADLSILAGQTAYIRVRGEISNHFLSDIAIDGLCLSDGGSCDPLPIELLHFDAKLKNNKVVCEWSTATEINTDYFIIERTTDGVYFDEVGFVKAAGNSFQTINYEFEDHSPLNGISYYRLKQYDLDGQNEAFGLVEVSHNIQEIELIQHPDHIQIYLPNDNSTVLTLYDIRGSIIKQTRVSNYYELPINSLETGFYFIVLTGRANIYSKMIGVR